MGRDLKLELEPLTPELIKKAEVELRETPERVEESVEELKKLLKQNSNLYYDHSPEVLIRYLRPVKFYPESALSLMRRIAEFKEKNKDLLTGLMPEKVEKIMLNEDIVNVLANRDHKGRRILINKAGKAWDPKKATPDQVFQMFYLIHQGALLEPATQVNGVVVILDFDGLGMAQVLALSPSFSLRLLNFIQDAMPLRLKEVHIVNQPWLFNMVWKIFKPLVKEKLNKRLHFHGNKLQELHKFIPRDYLPEDYGGSLPKVDYSAKDWYPILRSLDDSIRENNKYGLVKQS
ncbi:conserved hypothetical protein [Pediculus humanus corporis]|uniref:CRAL-TRIO domain-containing protein n=1 Tax=Pediculus humanus subsp. corporis TaxID=121224 RepID=E0VR96_PEDHC|nr:uncharacterized protein Phum_PHUM395600 [Pediculus humanus corporis]EEB15902.1 conserved hypothetical protein [Pediculus humanus corporis]